MRDRQVVCGSSDLQRSESADHSQSWVFNTVLDCVAGALVFGLIANDPGSDAPMLRVFLGGTWPGPGEAHMIFPSDCFS